MCSYGNHASSSLLNLPRDECKRILRRLELEAYCSTVSALRAQGDLTNEKKLLLQNLQDCLKSAILFQSRLLSIDLKKYYSGFVKESV